MLNGKQMLSDYRVAIRSTHSAPLFAANIAAIVEAKLALYELLALPIP